MKILLNSHELKKGKNDDSFGFVPTMGSIHKGHIYLIKRSIKEIKKTIVSIFINPTQFNSATDFKKYPKNIDKFENSKKLKIDFVFIPKSNDIYKLKRRKILLKKNEQIMC